MNANLIVDDPLATRETTIVITLTVSDRPREERPALVSVGVREQEPVIRTGLFGDLPALIDQAWTAFGVQAQTAAPLETEAALEAGASPEARAGEEVVATAVTADEPPANPPAPPPPAPRNLSLF
jgi:hypothetical protein